MKMVIGNTLEETAYHEAGHIVVACALGLPLRPSGITVYEVGNGVGDGYACYAENERPPQAVLMAVLAGGRAQLMKFPGSWLGGSGPDESKLRELTKVHFEDRWRQIIEEMVAQVDRLLEEHWSAVTAIAESLLDSVWIPVEAGEHSQANRKKQARRDSLVSILERHGIPATVRIE